MKNLLLAPLILILAACETTGGGSGGGSAVKVTYPKSTGTTKISDTVELHGSKDYGNRTVDGAGLRGDGGQGEDQEAPFYLYSGARLRNVIGKNWPESVSLRQGNIVIDGFWLPKTGEDAISSYKGHPCKGITIQNGVIADAKDKMIQLNSGASNVLIKNMIFDGPYKAAIRIKKGTGKVSIENCTFQNGLRAILLDKDASKPTVTSCKFINTVDVYRSDKNE